MAHTLIVMRHAKSSWKTSEADHRRPLSNRGVRDATLAGEILGGYTLDAVLSSSSTRTQQTWQSAEMGGARCADVTFTDELYGAWPGALAAVAWRYRDRFPIPGFALGVAVALKFFLWPLVLWLAATRRWRDAAIAAVFSPSRRSCSCSPSSRFPSTRGSCAGSGRTSTRTASPRSGCSFRPAPPSVAGASHRLRNRLRRPRARVEAPELRALRRGRAPALADRLARLLRAPRRYPLRSCSRACRSPGCCRSSSGESRRAVPAQGTSSPRSACWRCSRS